VLFPGGGFPPSPPVEGFRGGPSPSSTSGRNDHLSQPFSGPFFLQPRRGGSAFSPFEGSSPDDLSSPSCPTFFPSSQPTWLSRRYSLFTEFRKTRFSPPNFELFPQPAERDRAASFPSISFANRRRSGPRLLAVWRESPIFSLPSFFPSETKNSGCRPFPF